MSDNLEENSRKSKKIDIQVDRWDLFAKLAPAVFLLVCFVLLVSESVSFQTVFTIGMILFSLTAVIWWFWAIFSIRFLIKTLNSARERLVDVTDDLLEARKELKELKDLIDEENNRSKYN